jgi:hypothetical protein
MLNFSTAITEVQAKPPYYPTEKISTGYFDD